MIQGYYVILKIIFQNQLGIDDFYLLAILHFIIVYLFMVIKLNFYLIQDFKVVLHVEELLIRIYDSLPIDGNILLFFFLSTSFSRMFKYNGDT